MEQPLPHDVMWRGGDLPAEWSSPGYDLRVADDSEYTTAVLELGEKLQVFRGATLRLNPYNTYDVTGPDGVKAAAVESATDEEWLMNHYSMFRGGPAEGFWGLTIWRLKHGLPSQRGGAPPSHDYLGAWEAYHVGVLQPMIDSLDRRRDSIVEKRTQSMQKRRGLVDAAAKAAPIRRPASIRTFHTLDVSADTVHAMQKFINFVEFKTGSPITWDWRGTYTQNNISTALQDAHGRHVPEFLKDRRKWFAAVEGSGYSQNNIRGWKNKIDASIKEPDVMVVGGEHCPEDETARAVIFTLLCVKQHGCAIVRLQRVTSAASVSAIYLFSRCFARSGIHYSEPTDTVWLYGSGFTARIGKVVESRLMEYVAGDRCPFDPARADGFDAVAADVGRVFAAIGAARLATFTKMIETVEDIRAEKSADAVLEILQTRFPSPFKEWYDRYDYSFVQAQ
jgi:hypothetical protein